MAAFTVPPIVNSADAVRPPMPAMFTMQPPLALRCGHAARQSRIAPKNFNA